MTLRGSGDGQTNREAMIRASLDGVRDTPAIAARRSQDFGHPLDGGGHGHAK